MKNLPCKIYIQPNAHDRWFEGNKPNDNFVEYIRKGAFIKEAWDWIEDNMLSSNQQDNSNFYFKQFVNYMKGE